MVPLHNATLGFGSSEASGFAGCNRFSAEYATDGASSLTLVPALAGRRSCHFGDAFERRFIETLAAVRGYRIDVDGLSLLGPDGLVTLDAMAAAPFEGAWKVTMIDADDGAGLEAVPEGVDAMIVFNPDGTIGGSGGCGDIVGGYRVRDEYLRVVDGGPDGTCDDAFAERLQSALALSDTWALSPDALELRDADGGNVVVRVIASRVAG